MPLKPQALRNWKLGTGFAVTITGLLSVFNVDYGEQEHAFTGIQTWGSRKWDEFLGINPNSIAPPPDRGSAGAGRVRPDASLAVARSLGVGIDRNTATEGQLRTDPATPK